MTAPEYLFKEMTEYFGFKFSGGYGSVPTDAWINVLDGLSFESVQNGISRTCREYERGDFPPNPLDFRLLCMPTNEDLGLPSDDDAFNQAVGNASEKHPSVIHTLRNMGDEVYKLRRSESGKAEKIFKKHWDKTVEHVMAGGELPEVEKQVEDKPVKASTETAAEGMTALRGLFGD
jgi:hypothetical protein